MGRSWSYESIGREWREITLKVFVFTMLENSPSARGHDLSAPGSPHCLSDRNFPERVWKVEFRYRIYEIKWMKRLRRERQVAIKASIWTFPDLGIPSSLPPPLSKFTTAPDLAIRGQLGWQNNSTIKAATLASSSAGSEA